MFQQSWKELNSDARLILETSSCELEFYGSSENTLKPTDAFLLRFAAGTREDQIMNPGAVRRKEEFRMRSCGATRKRRARP